MRVFKRLLCLAGCVLLLTQPAGASQLDDGYISSVHITGTWELRVPGHYKVGPGRGDLAWQFYFYDALTGKASSSFLLANAFPLTEQAAHCFDDWPSAAQSLYKSAYDYFGPLLRFTSFDIVEAAPGDPVYVMFFKLQRGEREMDVTLSFRFQKSYYAIYLGVDNGDMPEMFLLTRRAAGLFRDETEQPFSADAQNAYGPAISPDNHDTWNLPIPNVFSILHDYTRWEFADKPSPSP